MKKCFLITLLVLVSSSVIAQNGWENWKPYSSESYYEVNNKQSSTKDSVEYTIFEPKFYVSKLQNRFISIDPHSSNYPNMTPYHYVHNSPIVKIDPNGMDDYYYQDSETHVVEERSWLWNLFVGDRYYAQHDQGNIGYNDQNYFQANSQESVTLTAWNSVDASFQSGDFLNRFNGAIPLSNDPRSSFDYAKQESATEGRMDQKWELSKKSLYLFNNIAYNRNEAGNIVWGSTMNHLGFSLPFTRAAAHYGAIIDQHRLDESHDQRAIITGHRYYNSMGVPRR